MDTCGRASQAEGTATAKALRLEHAWQRPQRPCGPHEVEQGGGEEDMRSEMRWAQRLGPAGHYRSLTLAVSDMGTV